MPTLLCVPILVHDADAALRDAAAARDLGADLVEFRIDEFFSGTAVPGPDTDTAPTTDDPETRAILRLVADSPLPCIITCRPPSEGGTYDGPEDARISLFERLGTAFGRFSDGSPEHPPRYLDVELSTWQRSANIRQKVLLAIDHPEQVRDLQTSLILSTHDFRGRPADLTRRILAMRETPAHVLKVAYLARSLRDNLELFDLLAPPHRDRPMIALAMGEFGLMSRILAPKFGGFLTFASLRPTEVTAPGQPTVADLLNLYRFRSITPATTVYGIVGWPVSHSLSPHLHNAGFEALNIDAVYLPLPIIGETGATSTDTSQSGASPQPAIPQTSADKRSPRAPSPPHLLTSSPPHPSHASLKASLLELLHFPPLNLRGVSVTLPHKESLVRLAVEQGWELDEPSAAIGAANTLVIDRDGSGAVTRCRIINTDVPALLDAAREAIPDLQGQRAAVLGAGGVARAAAYALARAGAIVTVFNRDESRATRLVAELARTGVARLQAEDLDSFTAAGFDLIINATSAGMKGGSTPDSSPVPAQALRPDPGGPRAAAMDTVYTPLRTPFLRDAERAGLRTLDGLSMFVRQAALQFSAFTGRAAPGGLFSRIAREAAAET